MGRLVWRMGSHRLPCSYSWGSRGRRRRRGPRRRLLFGGVAAALAAAAVHIAEVGTTAVSGISHASFGNVDWSKIVWMAIPGGIGGFLGASALVWASTLEATAGYVEPVVAIFLFCLGAYGLARLAVRRPPRPGNVRPIRRPAP